MALIDVVQVMKRLKPMVFSLVGDSLRDAGFLPDDLVFIDPKLTPMNGDYVACWLADGSCGLRLYRDLGERGRFLVSRNKAHKSVRIDPSAPPVVIGVYVALLRLTDRTREGAFTPLRASDRTA